MNCGAGIHKWFKIKGAHLYKTKKRAGVSRIEWCKDCGALKITKKITVSNHNGWPEEKKRVYYKWPAPNRTHRQELQDRDGIMS